MWRARARHLLRAPRPYLVRLIGKDFFPLLCRAFPLKRPFAQLQVLHSWVPDNAEVASVRITVFLLRVRAEGLMILLPGTDNVRELLDALNTADPGAPLLYTPVAVTCETPRRRNVGEIDLFLVDLPWSWLAYFRSGAVLRGSPLELVSIKSGQATVHPIQEAAQAAADLWIATAHPELLESGLGEYVTVAEDLGGLLRDDAALGEGDEQEHPGEIARVRARQLRLRPRGQACVARRRALRDSPRSSRLVSCIAARSSRSRPDFRRGQRRRQLVSKGFCGPRRVCETLEGQRSCFGTNQSPCS